MKQLIITIPLILFHMTSLADVIPENLPNNYALLFELQDATTSTTLWDIVITPSGMTILVSEHFGLKMTDEEISSFWKSAREVLNSFQFEPKNKEQKKWLFRVMLEIDQEIIVIQQRVGDLKMESVTTKKLIELCNRYLPEKYQVK